MSAAAGAGAGVDAGAEQPSEIAAVKAAHVPKRVIRCKVLLLGDAGAGKSAISAMMASGGADYPRNYVLTSGTKTTVKALPLKDREPGATVEMHMVETGGQAVFNQREFGTENWDGAAAVVVVYDVASRESFASCAKWLQRIYNYRGGVPIPGVLLGNKSDMEEDDRRVVTTEEGQEYAQSVSMYHFECSALRSTGVEEPFMQLANDFWDKYEQFISAVQAAD